jgi:hypothetical protein
MIRYPRAEFFAALDFGAMVTPATSAARQYPLEFSKAQQYKCFSCMNLQRQANQRTSRI